MDADFVSVDARNIKRRYKDVFESSRNDSFGASQTMQDGNPRSGILAPDKPRHSQLESVPSRHYQNISDEEISYEQARPSKRRNFPFPSSGRNSPLLPRRSTRHNHLLTPERYPAMTKYLKSRKSPVLSHSHSRRDEGFYTPPTPPPDRSHRDSLFNIPDRSMKLEAKQTHIHDHILGSSSYIEISDSEEPNDELFSDEEFSPEPAQVQKQGIKKANVDDYVLHHRGTTKATPRIKRLAGSLFGREIALAEGGGSKSPIKGLEKLTCDPATLQMQFEDSWEGSSPEGITYFPGDCVLVRGPDKPLEPLKKTPRNRGVSNDDSHSKYDNNLQSSEEPESSPLPWFARIAFLFEDKYGTGYAHLQWFRHGSDTIIEELASPRELFLTSECDDIELACLAGKLKVEHVKGEAANEIVETRFTKKNHFFYRFHYDNTKRQFTNATAYEDVPTGVPIGETYCKCCNQKDKQVLLKTPQMGKDDALEGSANSFKLDGDTYNTHDFIYIKPLSGKLCDIAQIVKINTTPGISKSKSTIGDREMRLDARLLYRCDVLHQFHEFYPEYYGAVRDERKLYVSEEVIDIPTDDLLGKCRVRHISKIEDLNKYKDEKDSFWVESKIRASKSGPGPFKVRCLQPSEMRYSKETEVEFSKYLSAKATFLAKGQKLSALELFAGCGGMTLGLDRNGGVETKYAIEFAPSTAATFKENFPGAMVYNEDVNVCLQRAVSQEAGIPLPENERDLSGQPAMAMPRRGDVDILVAGFPCPGFSMINASPKSDDIKNTLILPTLSCAEFYRPKYILLENVVGLLSHRLGAKQLNKNKTEGGIPRGTLKFIIRVLITLGYQVGFTVLQAGEHDTPQSRKRVFIWGAFLSHELPEFPQPTTIFPGNVLQSWHKKSGYAPHGSITVRDATSDLPSFDWVNPHNEVPLTYEENLNRLSRAATIEQIPVLPNQRYVGKDKQDYAMPPLCEYQRRLRSGVNDDQLVNHVTSSWFDKPTHTGKHDGLKFAKTEQVCSIPLTPGADHRDLPKALKQWCLSDPESKAAKHNFYPGRFGRLDADKPFPICLTTVEPGGKSKIIHPDQHRIASIREYLRAMGYPDWFKINLETTSTKLAYRMIGNSVPVPLSRAVGGGLLEVLVRQFSKESDDRVGVFSAPRPSAKSKPRPGKGETPENPIVLDDEIQWIEIDSD